MHVFTSTMSGLCIVLIANDRYFRICLNTTYEKHVTPTTTRATIFLQIGIATVWAAIFIYLSQNHYSMGNAISLCTFAVFQMTLLIEVVVINVRLNNHIRKRAKSTEKLYDRNTTAYHRRVTKTIMRTSVVLICAYAPASLGTFVAGLMWTYGENGVIVTALSVLSWIYLPTHLNSGLNAVVSILGNKGRLKSMLIGEERSPRLNHCYPVSSPVYPPRWFCYNDIILFSKFK